MFFIIKNLSIFTNKPNKICTLRNKFNQKICTQLQNYLKLYTGSARQNDEVVSSLANNCRYFERSKVPRSSLFTSFWRILNDFVGTVDNCDSPCLAYSAIYVTMWYEAASRISLALSVYSLGFNLIRHLISRNQTPPYVKKLV